MRHLGDPTYRMDADALLRPHADLAYRVALRITHCPSDAADVSQEALVRLWQHGHDIPENKRRAWVARVTRNAALDLLRRQKVRPQPATAELPDSTASTRPPDANAEAAVLRPHLDAALNDLGEPYRSIIWLREIEEFTYDEIADTLDLPLNTLKVYLHRARRRLREALRTALPEFSS